MTYNAQADDGWIDWNGGECPVPHHVRVEIKCRGFGDETDQADAGCYTFGNDWWKHEPTPEPLQLLDTGPHHTDIIAYRVVSQ